MRNLSIRVLVGLLPLACGDGSGGTAAIGELCNEVTPCAAGSFCDVSNLDWVQECGDQGRCVTVPASCPQEGPPLCGCDGELYMSACAAQMAQIATQGTQGCEPPAGKFGCDAEFCDVATEYCEHTVGGGSGESYRCRNLGCVGNAKGCGCLGEAPCGNEPYIAFQGCKVEEHGGVSVFCLLY